MKLFSLFQIKSVKIFGNIDQIAYLYYIRVRETLNLKLKTYEN